MKQGGAPQKDKNVDRQTISVRGIKYKKGLGCLTGSRIMFKLDGKAERFEAVIGIDDSYKGKETAHFKVYDGDFFGGQVLYDSGKMGKDSSAKIDINVAGVKYILLTVDGKEVKADWADVRVIAK